MKSRRFAILLILFGISLFFLTGCSANPAMQAPGVTLTVGPANEPQQVSSAVQLICASYSSIAGTIDPDSGNFIYPHCDRAFHGAKCNRYRIDSA